jgi:hypothetical protein
MKALKYITLLLVVLTTIFLGSCKKDIISPSKNTESPTSFREGNTPFCGYTIVKDLMAGQHINIGSVTVNNDMNNLYVTYNTVENWYINELHLYVGNLSGLPKTKSGNPIPGHFPYSKSFSNNTLSYTFVIPLSSISEDCYIIAAHSSVSQRDNSGSIIKSETAWGYGSRINVTGNWGMYFEACRQVCIPPAENEGCSMSQGYWFASPISVWPSTGVTVAGHTYTKEEAIEIWNTSNVGGIADSKKGFLQVATIYLSGATVYRSATVWADVAIVEAWLLTLGKLSPTNLPTGNNTVGSVAGNIGDWVDKNHCEE